MKEQTDVKSSRSQEANPATRAQVPCLWRAKCKRLSCDYRHPPVCHNYKSGHRCIHGQRCLRRHADGEEKPSKRSKRESTQGAVAILRQKKSPRLGISKFRSKEVYSTKIWASEIARFGGTHHKIPMTHLVRNSNSGKKRAIQRLNLKRRTS